MDFNDVNLLDIKFYSIDPMDSMIGIYNKHFLMIYQGASIMICKYDPDPSLFLTTFNKNFTPYKSIYSHEEKNKPIFDFFFSNFNSYLENISTTKLVEMFKAYNREYIINKIIND
jgi:hypothetical protein